MKTLIDINETLLRKAQKALGTRTKKETVSYALHQVLKSKKRRELASMIGRYRHGMTLKELLANRARS